MFHHGFEPTPLFVQLKLQLGDDLHLNASLRRRTVVQNVIIVQVRYEIFNGDERRLATGPTTQAVAEERVVEETARLRGDDDVVVP